MFLGVAKALMVKSLNIPIAISFIARKNLERQKMNERKPKTMFDMVLSTNLSLNQNTLVICNRKNRDGKTIMKTIENIETLKLVIFYGNKQGFLPNTVYTFTKQDNTKTLKSPNQIP